MPSIIACGQFCATSSIAQNLASCIRLLHLAKQAGACILFLPEASDYIGSSSAETVALAQSVATNSFILGLREKARELSCAICVGVHELVEETAVGSINETVEEKRGRVKNISLYIDEKGEVVQRYQKLHLFDVDIQGGPRMRESSYVCPPNFFRSLSHQDNRFNTKLILHLISCIEPGTALTPPFPATPLLDFNLGMQICFDIRFPESSLSLCRQGAQILSYAAAFSLTTGRAHWATLLRARAIETQSYVVGAALVGKHHPRPARNPPSGNAGGVDAGRVREIVTWGESMIIDPWGRVLGQCKSFDDYNREGMGNNGAEGQDEEEYMESICVAEVDREVIDRVRRELPLVRRM